MLGNSNCAWEGARNHFWDHQTTGFWKNPWVGGKNLLKV